MKLKQVITYTNDKRLKIRLRGKLLKGGQYSLYLDTYEGFKTAENGKLKTQRKIEYLKIFVPAVPKTTEERTEAKNNLTLALEIRAKRENQINSGQIISSKDKMNFNFITFCEMYKPELEATAKRLKYAMQNVILYSGTQNVPFYDIDEIYAGRYYKHLLDKYEIISANQIFKKFRQSLRLALKLEYISKNPTDGIKLKKPSEDVTKEILLQDEIMKLVSTPCVNTEVKRAFLFAILTGLRFGDVKALKYCNIENNVLSVLQQKTGATISIPLTDSAKNLLGAGEKNDYVFKLPYSKKTNSILQSWVKSAEIAKHITFHCARHTYATLLLTADVNQLVVARLLGHSDLRQTSRYTHIVETVKMQAVDKLPKF